MKFEIISKLFEELENKNKRLDKVKILKEFFIKNPKEVGIIFDLIAGNYQRKIEKRKIGISIKTIFSVLSLISSKNEKIIEKEFNKVGDVGIVAQNLKKENSNLIKKELNLKQILDALNKISNTIGKNSNKRKIEVLSELFYSLFDSTSYKFLSRLLIDDLRIGVSEGTLREACCCALFASIEGIEQTLKDSNKTIKKENISIEEYIKIESKYTIVLNEPRKTYNELLSNFEKKYNLKISFYDVINELNENRDSLFKYSIEIGKPFKSMLGPRSNSIDDAFDKTGKPALIDYKYDGLRVQIHNNLGEVKLFTRNLDDITKQFPEIVEYIKDNFSDLIFVLDSECVGYDFNTKKFIPFQILSRRILTKKIDNVNHISVVVRAFDILLINTKTLFNETYDNRREILENLFVNKEIKQKQKIVI